MKIQKSGQSSFDESRNIDLTMVGVVVLIAILTFCSAYRAPIISSKAATSATRLYYNYLGNKDDEKRKDPIRLLKNMIFPGIYQTYEDTKPVRETIRIKVPEAKPAPTANIPSFDKKKKFIRNDIDSFFSDKSKSGTYNMMDPTTAPVEVDMMKVKTSLKPVTKPANFKAPEPKKAIVSVGGLNVIPGTKKNAKPIVIYEYEASGECQRVRQACSLLDLIVEYRPCPGGVSGYSDTMSTVTGGKRAVPFMIDNNPSMYKPSLYGAKDIVTHLFTTYAPAGTVIPKNLLASGGGSKGKGINSKARSDNNKMKPITLYGWEGAQYVKPVRETLDNLGLAHTMINCANGSSNRSKLTSKTGTFQVPYIQDPNTGVEMFESADIVKYLIQTYTL